MLERVPAAKLNEKLNVNNAPAFKDAETEAAAAEKLKTDQQRVDRAEANYQVVKKELATLNAEIAADKQAVKDAKNKYGVNSPQYSVAEGKLSFDEGGLANVKSRLSNLEEVLAVAQNTAHTDQQTAKTEDNAEKAAADKAAAAKLNEKLKADRETVKPAIQVQNTEAPITPKNVLLQKTKLPIVPPPKTKLK